MDLSILLPLSNHLELTQECLASLERTTRGLKWEVILVDDGTTDGTSEFLSGLRGARYKKLAHEAGRPRGASACVNAAARVAHGSTFCTLSPAAVLLPDWVQPMFRLARRLPRVGCVGNVHREPVSGLIDYTGTLFDKRGLPGDAGRSTVAPPTEVQTRWPAVSPSCCLVRRALFEQLGGFDEEMPLELAGIDFCLRASEAAGSRHYTANRSVIYVHRGDLEKRPASEARQTAQEAGQRHFEEHWGERAAAYQRWEEAQLAAERAEAARDGKPMTSLHRVPEVTAEHWEDFCRGQERLWHRRWEVAREGRRQRRQDITDGRVDGWRYLRKHALRPWRYNWQRLGQALVKAAQPRPSALPKPPRYPRNRHVTLANPSLSTDEPDLGHPDAILFNPPAE